jgi:hypothetical protein
MNENLLLPNKIEKFSQKKKEENIHEIHILTYIKGFTKCIFQSSR